MNITKSAQGDQSVLRLEGRLDTTTAPDLQGKLLEEIGTGKALILDFTDLVYVSSAGLRVLLAGQKALNKRSHQTMTLRGVSQEVMEVFEMTGFVDILTIEQG